MKEKDSAGARWEPLGSLLRKKEEFGREALVKTRKRIKTGFSPLDELLGGGFEPGLIILGGSPGLGKSTLALFIAGHVAAEGTPVRYYSYEMTSKRLAHKLIACQNYKKNRSKQSLLFSSKEVFDPEALGNWSEDKWREYEAARQAVSDRAGNLFIIDCNTIENRYTAQEIAEDVESFIHNSAGAAKPLVIVDYLQILPPDKHIRTSDARLVVEDHLVKMVSLSRQVPVILISSLSRDSYKKPIQIESFKETGSIEYSADVLLGLQFTACQDKDGNPVQGWNLNAEKEKKRREIDVVVLKQRYGEIGKVPLIYYPAYDFFSDADQDEQEPPEERKQPSRAAGSKAEKASDSSAAPGAPPGESAEAASGPVYAAPVQADNAVKMPSAKTAEGTGGKRSKEGPKPSVKVCCINNTMIARELRGGDAVPNAERRCLTLPGQDKGKGIFTTYRITDTLSCADCDVADAIYSIFLAERRKFTMRQVLTTLTGDSSQTMTHQKVEAIRASIEKLRNTQITIDCTEEMCERKPNGDGGEVVFRGPLLTVEERGGVYHFPSVQSEDQKRQLKDLKDVMPLYAYAMMTRQIISFPSPLLKVEVESDDGERRKLSDTAETIAIKHFLIYRLEVIRNINTKASTRNSFRTISFQEKSELFKVLGIRRSDYEDGYWKKKRGRIRETVKTILDYFQLERIGYIAGYETTGKGSFYIKGDIGDPWKIN